MLTAMCHDFDRVTDNVSLQLIAVPQTQLMIDERICRLMRVAEATEALIDPGKLGPGPTGSPTSISSSCCTCLQILIQYHVPRYPGGYLKETTHQEYLRSVLSPLRLF